MPNSKRRKRQLAANKKQVEKAKRKIEEEAQKENIYPPVTKIAKPNECDIQQHDEDNPGWLGGIYSWCQTGITQGFQSAKDIVFPSRVLKRQLEDAQVKLRAMEEELEAVKHQEVRERKKRRKMKRQSSDSCQAVEVPQPPAVIPPPPPPPPPPSLASQPQRRVLTRSKTVKLQKSGGQPLPGITLDDIKNVKLRKPTEKKKATIMAPPSGSGDGFVVSLADLKNVKLRKSSTSSSGTGTTAKSSRRKSYHFGQRIEESPEFKKYRSSLRRVDGVRSPGGSRQIPQRSHDDLDTGTGLTPMLTRALKRKFQSACPLSPVKSITPVGSPVSRDLPSPVSQAPPSPPPPSAFTEVPPSPPPNSTETVRSNSPSSVFEIREI